MIHIPGVQLTHTTATLRSSASLSLLFAIIFYHSLLSFSHTMSYTPWRTPCLTLPWKLGWVSFVDRQTSGVRMNRESWRGARGALWQHSDSLLAEQWCVHLSPAHQSLAQKLSRQWKGCRQDKTFMFNCLGRFRNNSPFSFVKLISWKRMFSAHKQEAVFCFCCFLFFFKQLGNDLNLIHLGTCPSRMLERHQSWG